MRAEAVACVRHAVVVIVLIVVGGSPMRGIASRFTPWVAMCTAIASRDVRNVA